MTINFDFMIPNKGKIKGIITKSQPLTDKSRHNPNIPTTITISVILARDKHKKIICEGDETIKNFDEISSRKNAIKVVIIRIKPTTKKVIHIDRDPNKCNIRVAVAK
ncbi:MAG: hypothetical protein AAGA60_30795 [Cyanobacteria bacterium P01_E01_bin.42]